jgi:DNA helicase-2/ATP-dependent DNA helicase PcrA
LLARVTIADMASYNDLNEAVPAMIGSSAPRGSTEKLTSMAGAIFDSLTPVQREAVEHVEGPLLILAGPGSGKTRVVTHRVAHLVHQGINPAMILALTFTNKAADEMKERVRRLAPDAHVWIGTFHRFCSRLLRRYAPHVGLTSNFTIYDTSDSRQALKRALGVLPSALKMTTPDQVANQISWLKNHLITAEQYTARDSSRLSAILQEAYPAYQRELLSANAVDFDDLLLHVVTLLQQSSELRAALDEAFRYVMVDEYQDTNLAQYAIVRALSSDYPNLAVTGDPDQSIYGWRGANLKNILDFEHDYPDVRVVRLEQNYRSTPNILRVAQALISHNIRRKRKDLFTETAEGVPVRLVRYASYKDEADDIIGTIASEVQARRWRPRDFAVFYRVNALSRAFEHALREHGIPFQIVHGVEFYQRKEIKDVLAYLQLIYNPQDNNAFARIINVPSRRIGKTTLVRLADYARGRGISMLQAARESDNVRSLPRVAPARLQAFAALIDSLSRRATNSAEELLGLILTETAYLEALRQSDAPEDVERVANVEELLAAAREFDQKYDDSDAIGAFLEQSSLVNDIDDWNDETDRVTLMTLHASKGLEFPVVFIVGVEQGLLPHERCLNVPDQEEEERRLLFVGITRAKYQLQLSQSLIRSHRGGLRHTIPSPFLMELPRGEMEVVDVRGAPRPFGLMEYDDEQYGDEFSWRAASAGVTSGRIPSAARGPENAPRFDVAPALKTAAQLFATETSRGAEPPAADSLAPLDPASFEIGMTVIHPQYGPGKVAALSGQGKNRVGTINFATAGPKKFVLAQSPLRPVN